jgi:hypothetical protein
LIEANPTLDRRTLTYYLSEDLEKLYVAFIDVENVKKHISSMRRTFKSSAKGDRDILNEFWQQELLNKVKDIALRDNTSRSKVMGSMKDKVANSIVNSTVHGFGVTINEFKKSYIFRYLSIGNLKVAVNGYKKWLRFNGEQQ